MSTSNGYAVVAIMVFAVFLSGVRSYSDPTSADSLAPSPISYSPAMLEGASPSVAPAMATKEDEGKDRHYLEANMVAGIQQVEKFVSSFVMKRLSDPAEDESVKGCLLVCAEVYDGALDSLRKGVEDVSVGDLFKAKMDVSMFSTNIDTCGECLDASSEPEFQKFDQWARGIANDCHDKIAKYTG